MAARQIKIPDQPKIAETHETEPSEQVFTQRKRPEAGRYLLQVDRQTKGSYESADAAHSAGTIIKTQHPAVRVTIFDSVETVNTVVEKTGTS